MPRPFPLFVSFPAYGSIAGSEEGASVSKQGTKNRAEQYA